MSTFGYLLSAIFLFVDGILHADETILKSDMLFYSVSIMIAAVLNVLWWNSNATLHKTLDDRSELTEELISNLNKYSWLITELTKENMVMKEELWKRDRH